MVFYVVLRYFDSNRGALIAAAAGGAATALVWLVWDRVAGLRPVGKLVDLPSVGSIPATPGAPTPTLTAPDSAASNAYQRAASRLEASTKGRVLLVSGMSEGQGATTAALNLAIAATRAGRRTLLIDGASGTSRLSHFGRTGVSPGLTELAAGESTIGEASRLWTLDPTSRLPFIPAGEPLAEGTDLDRATVAEALDEITTAADLVLIDTAAHAGLSLDALGALADGTLLVLPKAADRVRVDSVQRAVTSAGAPPIGYVVNEAAPSPPSIHQHPVLRSMKRAVATAMLVLIAYGAWNGFQVWNSWRNVERHTLDVAAASEVLPLPEFSVENEGLGAETVTAMTAVPAAEGDFLAMLLVGTDLSGSLADVITLVVIPSTEDDAVMVSIPRDLYVTNRCTGSFAKINSNLAGCGDIEGETMLALAVEDYTGIHVDHMALFTFEGFEEIIDAVGGIEICVEYDVRDSKSHLDLPAGCTLATGEQALSWVRSRRTQELVNGSWRTMSNVSDLTRNERQQDVILDMLSKLGDFSSVDDLTRTAQSLIGAFSLDDDLGLTDAINLAWSLKDVDPITVQTLKIPVADERTDSGAAVLVATQPFDQILAEVYPDLAPTTDN